MSKSTLARGASMAADVWGKLDTKVQAKGGTTDALHILAKQEGEWLLETIADLIVKAERVTITSFTVTVDYTKTVEEMVAEGKYDSADSNIRGGNFPITLAPGTHEEEEILVHFDRFIESDDAVQEMDQMGLEPSPIEELLAFGAKYPDVQRQFLVVGLGSSWVGPGGDDVCVPVLDRNSDERDLYLFDRAYGWDDRYRFLARRKRQKPLDTGTL